MKYRVTWTEKHVVEVEAADVEEAYNKALNEDHDSFQGLSTHEIEEVNNHV